MKFEGSLLKKVDECLLWYQDGFRWLVDNILTNWEPLNERVVRDVQLQKEQEQLARKAKAERIRKLKEERLVVSLCTTARWAAVTLAEQ